MSDEQANKGGRPTAYRQEFCEQAYKLCLLGHTDAELAKFFGVSEATVNNWKQDYPEFLESIKDGKEIADAEVAKSLYNRAIGYSHDDVEIKVVANGDNMGSRIVEVPVVKHYPPDTGAAMAWLKNRQPKNWRDKQEIEVTNVDLAERAKRARERVNGASS